MSTTNNTQSQQPSLVGGHAEYIKGVAQSTVGSVTGSHAWTGSGEQAKAHAVDTMKAAGDARDPSSQGYGKVEEVAGKITGCEGMQQEGLASKKVD